MKKRTVGDLLDSPQGETLLATLAREAYESDLRLLRSYQESALRGGATPSKALWKRVMRYRRRHGL